MVLRQFQHIYTFSTCLEVEVGHAHDLSDVKIARSPREAMVEGQIGR